MALEQQPVTVCSDRQPAKGVPEQISAAYGDGTLDTARTRLQGRRGPKTTAGKARVAVNALTHGISSTRPVVPGESRDAWDTHLRAIVDALGPAGPLETSLAERAASAIWRLQRVTSYEEAAIAERQHLPAASARLLPHPLEIDKIIRYEAHLSRQLFQALHELESMRAARRGQPAPLLRVDLQGAADTFAAREGATS
jgi:hypothetical protein